VALGDYQSGRDFNLHSNNTSPRGLAAHSDGRIFCADNGRGSVFVYDLTDTGATYRAEIDISTDDRDNPSGLTCHGDMLYVTFTDDDTHVYPYAIGGTGASTTLTAATTIDITGITPTFLRGISTDGTNLYLVDQASTRALRAVSLTGVYNATLSGNLPSKTFTGLAVHEGKGYLTNNSDDRIDAYSNIGTGAPAADSASGWVLDSNNGAPHAITIRGGYAYVTDNADNKVYVYEGPAPAVLSAASAPTVTINAVAAGGEGTTVQLGATLAGGTYDTLTYAWTVAEGTLNDATSATPVWTRPTVVADKTVAINLTVTARGTGTRSLNGTSDTAQAAEVNASVLSEIISTDTIYRAAPPTPVLTAPSGGTTTDNHTPAGWTRTKPQPTETNAVWKSERTVTRRGTTFISATAWGTPEIDAAAITHRVTLTGLQDNGQFDTSRGGVKWTDLTNGLGNLTNLSSVDGQARHVVEVQVETSGAINVRVRTSVPSTLNQANKGDLSAAWEGYAEALTIRAAGVTDPLILGGPTESTVGLSDSSSDYLWAFLADTGNAKYGVSRGNAAMRNFIAAYHSAKGSNSGITSTLTFRERSDIEDADAPTVSISAVPNGEEGKTHKLVATVQGGRYDSLTYKWTVSGGTLDDSTAESPTWTRPEVTRDTSYSIGLTVTAVGDGTTTTDEDTDAASATAVTTTVLNVTVTTDTDTIWQLAASKPETPHPGSRRKEAPTPRGWTRTKPTPTLTQDVWKSERTRTYRDNSADGTYFSVATYFGEPVIDTPRLKPLADAPTVSIDAIAQGDEGTAVDLTATLAGGTYDTLTYAWTVTGGTLANDDEASPTWTRPPVNADTNHTVSLTVTARGSGTNARTGTSDTATASLQASVRNIPITMTTDTIYQLAATRPDVPTGGTSTDNHTPQGWTRVKPSPTVQQDVWKAERTVTRTDGAFTSATAWGTPAVDTPRLKPLPTIASVTITAIPDTPEGLTATLAATLGATNNDSLTYAWTATGGTFDDAAAVSPVWTAPAVSADTDYTISLTVTARGDGTNYRSGETATAQDSETVTVLNVTTDTDTIYIRSDGVPATPSGGTDTEAHEPSGWDRDALTATATQDAYKSVRTRTYRGGTFHQATAWGAPTLHQLRPASIASVAIAAVANVDEGGTVSLSATLGAGARDGVAYAWSAPSGTFDDDDVANPTWTAPALSVATQDVVITLQVTVTGDGTTARSGTSAQASDTETIRVLNITTDTDTVYRTASSNPGAPAGGANAETHTPTSWQRSPVPDSTLTEDVWKSTRTRTYAGGNFRSATAWGAPIVHDDRIAVTTDTDVIYQTASSKPSKPTGGTTAATHTPTGWTRTRPTRSTTATVWKSERTRTYHDGTFHSATAWGSVAEDQAQIAVTTNTDTIYQVAVSLMGVPAGGTGTENHTPDGWSRDSNLKPTTTEHVWKVTRTRTYHDGVFESATVWGSPAIHDDKIVVTTTTDTVYRLAASRPGTPSGGRRNETQTPQGWSRTAPDPTVEQDVWKSERTITYHDGDFESATAWGTAVVHVVRLLPLASAPAVTIDAIGDINKGVGLTLSATLTGGIYDTILYQWAVSAGATSSANAEAPSWSLSDDIAQDKEVTIILTITVTGTGTKARTNTTDTARDTETFTVVAVRATRQDISDDKFNEWLESEKALPVIIAKLYYGAGNDDFYMVGSQEYITAPDDTPANRDVPGVLDADVDISESLAEFNAGNLSIAKVLDVTPYQFAMRPWYGHPVKIYLGDMRWRFANFRLVAEASNGGITGDDATHVSFDLEDAASWLNFEVTGPQLYGACYSVPAELSDAANLEYRFRQNAALDITEAITTFRIYDSGVLLYDMDSDSNHWVTSHVDTYVTGTARSQGTFRLPSQAAGTVTVDFGISRKVAAVMSAAWDASERRFTLSGGHAAAALAAMQPGRSVIITDHVTAAINETYTVATVDADNNRFTVTETGHSSDAASDSVGLTVLVPDTVLKAILKPFVDAGRVKSDVSAADDYAGNDMIGGYFVPPDTTETLGEIIRQIIESTGGSFRIDKFGNLEFFRMELPASSATVEITDDTIVQDTLQLQEVQQPLSSITMRYRRNWHTYSSDGLPYSVPLLTRILITRQFRGEVTQNITVANQADYPKLRDRSFESFANDSAAVQSELSRLEIIRSQLRFVYRVETFGPGMMAKVGDTIKVTSKTYGFGSGAYMRIVGVERDVIKSRVTLTLWK